MDREKPCCGLWNLPLPPNEKQIKIFLFIFYNTEYKNLESLLCRKLSTGCPNSFQCCLHMTDAECNASSVVHLARIASIVTGEFEMRELLHKITTCLGQGHRMV